MGCLYNKGQQPFKGYSSWWKFVSHNRQRKKKLRYLKFSPQCRSATTSTSVKCKWLLDSSKHRCSILAWGTKLQLHMGLFPSTGKAFKGKYRIQEKWIQPCRMSLKCQLIPNCITHVTLFLSWTVEYFFDEWVNTNTLKRLLKIQAPE